MNGLLVRVGSDQSSGGGRWNGPVDLDSREFVYVPIPETKPAREGLAKPYSMLMPFVRRMGLALPDSLLATNMHLDPDFECLTYGDRGRKGLQLAATLEVNDFVVFYSGLRAIASGHLVYALIGIFYVQCIRKATTWSDADADRNAHTRRVLAKDADDIVLVAQPDRSGRLTRCIPIGEYRAGAYRLKGDVIAAWGGLSAKDGYLQRSAVFPRLLNPTQFLLWWQRQRPELVRSNNLVRTPCGAGKP